jgi:hypothetical protein
VSTQPDGALLPVPLSQAGTVSILSRSPCPSRGRHSSSMDRSSKWPLLRTGMISEDESSSEIEAEAKTIPSSVEVTSNAEILRKEVKNCARKPQFRFNEESEIVLTKQASAHASCEAPHGSSQTAWDDVADNLRS